MLSYRLLKNHAGMLLIGDYATLNALYDVVGDINEHSSLIADKEGTFLGLAYDLRKAYSGQREIIEPPEAMSKIGVRYGVAILWPILLLQVRMLRCALGFFDSTKLHQAFAFALEAIVEQALQEDFGNKAPTIMAFWMRIDPGHPWPDKKLDSRCAQFCLWSKKERFDGFIGLLASLDPLYDLLYQQWTRQDEKVIKLADRHFSRHHLVSPEDLDALDGTEWADPKW